MNAEEQEKGVISQLSLIENLLEQYQEISDGYLRDDCDVDTITLYLRGLGYAIYVLWWNNNCLAEIPKGVTIEMSEDEIFDGILEGCIKIR